MSVTFPGGWPNRIERDDLGPNRTDDGAVTEHEKARAAECDNLADWQLAGLSQTGWRWWFVVHWDGTDLNVEHSGEVWDPNDEFTPTASRTSAGRYRISYDTTYNDRDGNSVSTALVAVGVITAQDDATDYDRRGEIQSNLRDVDIEIDEAGNPADVRVFVAGM